MPTWCPQNAYRRVQSRAAPYIGWPLEHAEQGPHLRLESITQIYEGTNQVQRLVMGRKLLA